MEEKRARRVCLLLCPVTCLPAVGPHNDGHLYSSFSRPHASDCSQLSFGIGPKCSCESLWPAPTWWEVTRTVSIGLLCSQSPFNSPARAHITLGSRCRGLGGLTQDIQGLDVQIRIGPICLLVCVRVDFHGNTRDTRICVYSVQILQLLLFPLACAIYKYICTYAMSK